MRELVLHRVPEHRQKTTTINEPHDRTVRQETHARIQSVVSCVICPAPSAKSADSVAASDDASRSARIVLLPLDGEVQVRSPERSASFAHAGVAISAT